MFLVGKLLERAAMNDSAEINSLSDDEFYDYFILPKLFGKLHSLSEHEFHAFLIDSPPSSSSAIAKLEEIQSRD